VGLSSTQLSKLLISPRETARKGASMAYIVPGMTLIPQTKAMACWYASAQMLITWRREHTRSCEVGIVDPSEDSSCGAMWSADGGISDAQIVGLAKSLGLEVIPPMSFTEAALEGWLRDYGPLWVNGTTHIVVIAGVANGAALVYDPWPINVGNVSWRSLTDWYEFGGAADSRDVNTNTGVLLYVPR